MAKETKNKGGQPTKYEEGFVQVAKELCLKGYTNKELANHFNVSEATIYNWKRKYLEFFEAVKESKDFYDTENVEAALIKRSEGYEYTEVTRELRPVLLKSGKNKGEPSGKTELVVVKEVDKQVAPSDVAIIFHLKNRQPDRWSDKKEIDHRVEDLRRPLSDEEIRKNMNDMDDIDTGLDTRSIDGGNNDSQKNPG